MSKLVRHIDVRAASRTDAAGVFIGSSVDLGWGRVYGGQTMAQALAACQQLAGPSRVAHDIGCHFLKGGDVQADVRFEVETLSRGRSFTCVHARALQSDTLILSMTASFQEPERGLEHQPEDGPRWDEWGTPDALQPLEDHMAPQLPLLPEKMRWLYTAGRSPFDLRPNAFVPLGDATRRAPDQALWIRSREPLPDDANVHQRLLTYLSDWGFLATAMLPHGTGVWSPAMQAASLSHSVHFHHDFRLDHEWLCHVMHSPVASGGRGYARGEVWTEGGLLVATTAQEGLMRLRTHKSGRG